MGMGRFPGHAMKIGSLSQRRAQTWQREGRRMSPAALSRLSKGNAARSLLPFLHSSMVRDEEPRPRPSAQVERH